MRSCLTHSTNARDHNRYCPYDPSKSELDEKKSADCNTKCALTADECFEKCCGATWLDPKDLTAAPVDTMNPDKQKSEQMSAAAEAQMKTQIADMEQLVKVGEKTTNPKEMLEAVRERAQKALTTIMGAHEYCCSIG